MIKGFFTTLAFLSIFFLGVHYALEHPKLSKEIMSTMGCDYNPGRAAVKR